MKTPRSGYDARSLQNRILIGMPKLDDVSPHGPNVSTPCVCAHEEICEKQCVKSKTTDFTELIKTR